MVTKDDYNVLFYAPFGSHLYGTATPESDFDFKGVYLPDTKRILLGKIPQSVKKLPSKADGEKNKPGDNEWEMFSLHEFIRLALEGQTVALDMLHAHRSQWVITSPAWEELVSNRHRFYTKNLKAFIGYARRQAAKYGIKGSRLATGKAALEWLKLNSGKTIKDALESPDPETFLLREHVNFTGDPTAPLEILGKKLTSGATTDHYLPTIEKYVGEYGDRARAAERSEGVDWKAVSHAVRAAIEVRYILKGEEWSLPFPGDVSKMLVAIKMGIKPFPEVQYQLEELMAEVEELAQNSDLPEKPDRKWAENLLFNVCRDRISLEISKQTNEAMYGWWADQSAQLAKDLKDLKEKL